MYYTEQKELAKQIFEKLGLNVDLTGCFDKIIPQLTIEQCIQVLNLVDDEKVRSEWAYNVGKFKPEARKDVINFVTDSEYAYYWALYIGNRDIMIDKISDSEYAFRWAKTIGDRDVMIDRVTDSKYAYYWALYIGNRDIMIDRVADSFYALLWARDIGDRNVMIDRICVPGCAYYWATNIGNIDIMLPRFVNTDLIFDFIEHTKSRKGIKQHLTNPDIIKKWIKKFGDKKYFTTKFPELSFA